MPWSMYTRPVRSVFFATCSSFKLICRNADEESRPAAGKVLAKWRPKAAQPQQEQQTTLASRGATSAAPVGSA